MWAVQEGGDEQGDQPERPELQHALHQHRADHGERHDRSQVPTGQDRAVGRGDLSAKGLPLLRLVELWVLKQAEDHGGGQ